MKRKTIEPKNEMLPEYDFTVKNAVRGKHAKALRAGYITDLRNENQKELANHLPD